MPIFDNKPALSITIVASQANPLSKEQKAFNALIRKIERRRAKLAEWVAVLPQIQQKVMDDLLPLQRNLADLQMELAVALDAAHSGKSMTKAEKRKISIMIEEAMRAVLDFRDDDEAKVLLNKHAMTDFAAEEAEHLAAMQGILETLGIDLGEEVPNSPEELMDCLQNRFNHVDEAQEAQRKISPRETAKLAKREAEEKLLSQSIREIFRKLASALHPDRELDPTERERKTTLMQRVNEAYEQGNLLQLLELQLEIEQIDQDHLATVGPERLKHYTKILKGQLQDLDAEIADLAGGLTVNLGLSPFVQVEPSYLMGMLRSDIMSLRALTAEIKSQLHVVQVPGELKGFLKHVTLRRKRVEDLPF